MARMARTPVRLLGRGLNRLLRPLGVEIRRTNNPSDPKNYLPFNQTISAARAAQLSVGDYVDQKYNVPGGTQATLDHMVELGVFASPISVVAEIGPGSGRYLEKTVNLCSPKRYEVYETAGPWARYLVSTYGVVLLPTDGVSLRGTETNSVDLVQAHKVFVVTTFLTTCHYWLEMLRVTRPLGHIVFDVMTEHCMDAKALEDWLAPRRNSSYGIYPTIVPHQYTVDFFESRGASLVGSFQNPMLPGRTETFVFKNQPDPVVPSRQG